MPAGGVVYGELGVAVAQHLGGLGGFGDQRGAGDLLVVVQLGRVDGFGSRGKPLQCRDRAVLGLPREVFPAIGVSAVTPQQRTGGRRLGDVLPVVVGNGRQLC